MHSNRPYLLRAFYEWIADNGCTPILVVNANYPGCKVPKDYVEGGEIVFNISLSAVRDLKIANDFIEFKASFSGVIHFINVPTLSVIALYAEENGEGLFFDAEDEGTDAPPAGVNFSNAGVPGVPNVAGMAGASGVTGASGISGTKGATIENISKAGKKGKPYLRLVE